MKLLILLVIVLGIIAIAQLTRVYELTRGRIPLSEVKFLDFWKTNDCESIYQGCFH